MANKGTSHGYTRCSISSYITNAVSIIAHNLLVFAFLLTYSNTLECHLPILSTIPGFAFSLLP